jgi:hypothetical protein
VAYTSGWHALQTDDPTKVLVAGAAAGVCECAEKGAASTHASNKPMRTPIRIPATLITRLRDGKSKVREGSVLRRGVAPLRPAPILGVMPPINLARLVGAWHAMPAKLSWRHDAHPPRQQFVAGPVAGAFASSFLPRPFFDPAIYANFAYS